jgi:thiol-disulfide isomerase/thioredoxin
MRFCFALCLCLAALVSRAEDPTGELAPNWILSDLSGTQVSLYQEAEAGITTVMFFWASWCNSCKTLLPVIKSLDAAKGDKPVRFYLMNVWEDNDPVAFLQQHQVQHLPVLLQAENVAQRYDIKITPGIVVVDAERRIRYVRQPGEGVAEVTTSLQKVLDIKL